MMMPQHQDLITNWTKKKLGQKLPRKYSPQIRQFTLSLHFFSAKAYTYVRQQFNTILPHPRTLSKWYSHLKLLLVTSQNVGLLLRSSTF
ncbi:THAP domain-containing protein 1-like [Aphis craccivora]|uniref:THAP domain-containing protein 1-like n=1 Tax=Aphis craccivora TaxID=307492 RepID=A0A6G0WDP3_APHCR|nr:THAP domain-containing protein 1-like [Aphis craccivora]